MCVLFLPPLVILDDCLKLNYSTVVLYLVLMVLLAKLVFKARPCKVFLVDFACYKPKSTLILNTKTFIERVKLYGKFSDENIEFSKRLLERSGIGQLTYLSEALVREPPNPCLEEARKEAEMVMFGAVGELLEKTGVKAKDIGIVVVSCSIFSPSPSLSAMIVNHFKLRDDVKSYNLGGMGCSSGLLAIGLVKNLLQVHPNSYALVVSTENITQNFYTGTNQSMLILNCVFRVGAAAILLSSHPSDSRHSKYQLKHTVRTHAGSENGSYNCVIQEEDSAGLMGITTTKDLTASAAKALKSNIAILGPLVLPMTEKLRFLANSIGRKLFKNKKKPYVPDFSRAFEHFITHVGAKPVIDEMEKNLKFSEWCMEPARMTLYRFGNTACSSVWYELAYCEAKGRIKKGDRLWQIAFGSGFKCSSAVWHAMRTIDPTKERNPWTDEIENFPVKVKNEAPFPFYFEQS